MDRVELGGSFAWCWYDRVLIVERYGTTRNDWSSIGSLRADVEVDVIRSLLVRSSDLERKEPLVSAIPFRRA